MEVLLTILLFVVVMIIGAVLFAGWVTMTVLRAVWNGVGLVGRTMMCGPAGGCGMFRRRRQRLVVCRNGQCRQGNPPGARFCRRCGQPMVRTVQVVARRAAMF